MQLASWAAWLALVCCAGLAHAGPLADIDGTCRKVLWLTGMQAKTHTGDAVRSFQAQEVYLKKAIESARKNAGSVLPVVVFEGAPPAALADWIVKHGGLVMQHKLMFRQELIALAARPGWEYTSELWGSYLRVDLPGIMENLPLDTARRAEVELDYVLWTDIDVLFINDLNSCTLPRPLVMSIGSETAQSGLGNTGVIYFNVEAYTAMFPGLMDFAQEKRFEFGLGEQSLLRDYFGHRFNELPDTLNWKPYWGAPANMAWGPYAHLVLVHLHGPKIQAAVCAFDKFKIHNISRVDIDGRCHLRPGDRSIEILEQECNMKQITHLDPNVCLLRNAFKADGGKFYWQLYQQFFASGVA